MWAWTYGDLVSLILSNLLQVMDDLEVCSSKQGLVH